MKMLGLVVAAVLLVPAFVMAAVIPYGNPGVINPDSYTFMACADSIDVYFYGSDAAYGSWIGLEVYNVTKANQQLYNHSSNPGDMVTMSGFSVGDTLVFTLEVSKQDNNVVDYLLYSEESKNSDGLQHIYSTSFSGTLGSATINNGTYIGWEDRLRGDTPDWDYNDHQFVFTGVCGVPDGGSTVALLGLACAAMGLVQRKFRNS